MLILSALSIVSTNSASADQAGDYDFVLAGQPSEATIVRYHGAGGNIAIPSTLGGSPVTAIGAWAFYSCRSLTSVSIPNGVPNGVTSIGDFRSLHAIG
jgi:hypothetical protein